MTYVDYDYYSNTYKGRLTSDLFNSYVLKASKEIDRNVNKRLVEEDITDDVKYVTCELIDAIYSNDNSDVVDSDGRPVNSITIDGVKKGYKTTSESEKLSSYNAKKRAILKGLPHRLTRYI